MQGIHRVEIKSIEKIEIKPEENGEVFEENKSIPPSSLIIEDSHSESTAESQEHQTPKVVEEPLSKKKGSSLTKEIIAILESKRNLTQKILADDDPNYFLTVNIGKIVEPEFDVDIALETKLKHLIDIYSKILYMNKGQIPLVNYNLNDANRIIDSLGGVLSSMGYYKKNDLQEAFEIIDISERLNKIHILASKYLSFLQNFSDVGVILKNKYF